ncbi:MAG TPA: hypothetical protein VL989_01275 [Candidatus Sulfotelmatobacter sp.]|nr:hypothetical protein [Candidatus Sulfotelmatobacter sp.]
MPSFLAGHLPQSERHYVELAHEVNPFQGLCGEQSRNSMLDAMFALGAAFQNPELQSDPFFNRFKSWLATFELKVTRWELDINNHEQEVYEPVLRFGGSPLTEPLVYDPNDPGPTTEVLGRRLSRNDLVAFTHYVMTNSGPEGPNDPRYAFIESIKS